VYLNKFGFSLKTVTDSQYNLHLITKDQNKSRETDVDHSNITCLYVQHLNVHMNVIIIAQLHTGCQYTKTRSS